MKYKYLLIISFFLFSKMGTSNVVNIDSLFFEALNIRYQNPDKGIELSNSLRHYSNNKAQIALGYNYFFKSDYDKARVYFDSIINNSSNTGPEYYLALTGNGLIQQRYGKYDTSYKNLIRVDEYFSFDDSTNLQSRLYLEAKTINLIGLATLQYYYINDKNEIEATLDKIKYLLTTNNNGISDEIKIHLYYLYAENFLHNNQEISKQESLSNYLDMCLQYADTSQYYHIGNLFQLIGEYKLNKNIFDFANLSLNDVDSTNVCPRLVISGMFQMDSADIKSLKTSLFYFMKHGDPYQIAISNLLISKTYFSYLTDDFLFPSLTKGLEYNDSISKYLINANAFFHIRDTSYFNRVFHELTIESVDLNLFISKLLSLDWYIVNLKHRSLYYGLMNKKSSAIQKEYLFIVQLTERLENEKNKALNGFVLEMESAKKEKLKTKIESKNFKFDLIVGSAVFIILISFIIIIFYINKSKKLQLNFKNKEIELEKATEEIEESAAKQATSDTMEKLIAWFAHETKTSLEIAVTGLTTNKKLLDKFGTQGSFIHNSNEFYRMQRINQNSELILENIKQTNRVIKQLRIISLKQIKEDLRIINLKDFLVNIFEKMKYQHENMTIKLILSGDVDVVITTYPIALDQIFFNLMINSIKHGFSERKNGEIVIDVKQRSSHFEIEYSDDGKGIDKVNQNKIFNEFYSSIKGGGGTGLGMSITKTLIERDFSGSIRLKKSIPNIRTTFIINIKKLGDETKPENKS